MRGALVMLVMLWPAIARAEDPWVVGVSAEQKQTAQHFLEAGNALFVEKNYPEALRQYEAAVAAWNHPAIRFNIVRCLIQLERPTEAFDALEQALVYGAAPLEDNVYVEALAYQKLLAHEIGHLEVACTQPGARISLDGQVVIASCPGKTARRVTPGRHLVVGEKDRFLTVTRETTVVGGERDALVVVLVPLADAARVTRRWASWKPWLVFGGGLALVGVGGGLQFIASSNLDSYDRQITADCASRACNPSTSPSAAHLVADRDRALAENRFAIGIIGAGVAATVTGAVLLYLNRAQTVYERVHLDLSATTGGASVAIGGAF